MFDVQRRHYMWYNQPKSYLLLTINNIGAVPELWGRWIKKGYFMNKPNTDQAMEKAFTKTTTKYDADGKPVETVTEPVKATDISKL